MDRNTGIIVNKLKEYWVENDCNIGAEEILKHVPSVLEELKNTPPTLGSPKVHKKRKNV